MLFLIQGKMNTENKRAVIYCRVSTREQVELGNSLATQEKVCKEYAIKNGFTVVEIFKEKGESAKNANRTELTRLLDYCTNKKHGIKAVIAYKVDRIARNIDDYRYIRVLLKRYCVEIKSTSEYFEDTPAGRFMENIIANVAQFDNDVRTERSVGGMRDAIREGRYVWMAPFGYTNTRINGKSNISPDEHADVVRMTFEEVAKNEESVDVIRKKMFRYGLCSREGKQFSRGYLYRLLKNEIYAGWISKFGERHKGLFDPIVSEELFDQVQRVLKQKKRRSKIYQKENPDFPLRRFVQHPCGIKATGYWAKGSTKRYPYYRFIGVRNSDTGKRVLENKYKAYLNKYSLTKRHIASLKASLEAIAFNSSCVNATRLTSFLVILKPKNGSLANQPLRMHRFTIFLKLLMYLIAVL